jgi:hypothetical protein
MAMAMEGVTSVTATTAMLARIIRHTAASTEYSCTH